MQAALVACCMAAAGCGQAPVAMGPGQYAVLTVSTSDREIPTHYSAAIRGRQDIAIYPQVSGTISQLCINEGDAVSKGQTLFIIDQVPYKAALQTAEANVAAAKASVATAQLTYDSKKELFAKKVVSQYDLSTAENMLLTAKAQLAQAEAQRVNAANSLSYTVVKAPASGVAGTLPYRVGALVGPSMPQPLTTISDNSQVYVYFSMSENQLLGLTRQYGSIANTLANMPDVQLHEGRLLHSGGSGNIVLPTEYRDCIVIPQAATFELQDKVYVYKVIDGKASAAQIDVEKISNGREYIVKSGIAPGETIVAEGVGLLREGTPIVPKDQNAAVAAQGGQQAAPAAETETGKEE